MFTQGPAVVFKWREASGWPVEHVSENVKDVLGYDAEELTSGAVSFSDIIHEADRERVIQTVMEHSEEGVEQFSHQPYRIVTADGAVRWVLDFTRNVWEDGEIVHRQGYLVDITERRQNERYLQTAQEVADIGWWRKEIPSDRIYWSDRVYDMWGADGERGYLDHEQFLELIHPEDTDRVDQAWQAALDGEPYDIEHRIITGDGDVRWMREVAEFSYDTDDNPTGAIGIVQDITERKEYEEALEAAREELRQIIDLVPDLVFVKNREGEYLLANEATAEAYGLTPEEVEGKREAEIIPTVEDSEEFRKDDMDVIESGEPKKIPEEELTTADGETRILETTKIPYETSAGGETAVLGYARDVTELKEYEQRLETQRDNLDILNQVVRHDIRNDLQLVLTYGETLEAYVEEDGQEYVQRVLEAAHNAVEITTTARDVTEVMLQSDVDRQPVQLRAALEREVTSVQSSQERALVKVDGSIPAVEVYADDMLESVFRNLLSNAVQHNDKEVPEVTVSATVADWEVVVRVADNGPGIPDERKADIFEQGEMGLDSEGTGLGLYLVDTLVGRYGGEIHVEDNEPDGSVFVVRLPVVSE
jgi:PAS domain S-box-containing protein